MHSLLKYTFGYSAFIFLLAAQDGIASGVAVDGSQFIVRSLDCPVQKYSGAKWRKVTPPWITGDKVRGRLWPGKTTYAYLTFSGTNYAVETRCLAAIGGRADRFEPPKTKKQVAVAEATADTTPTARSGSEYKAPVIRTPKKQQAYVSLAWVSWQQTVTLSSTNTANEFNLRAAQNGFCPGGGYRIPISKNGLIVDLGGCLLFAENQVSASSTDPSGSSVPTSSGLRSIVLRTTPTLRYLFPSQKSGIGITLPLLYVMPNWPNPTGFEFKDASGLRFGAELEAYFEKDRFGISPRMGFISTTENLSFSLSLSYQL
jgi:hypothetical protein